MGRLTEKTVEWGPSLEGQGLNGADLAVLVVPFLDGSSNRVEAGTDLDDPMFVLLIIDYFAIAEHYSKDGYVS